MSPARATRRATQEHEGAIGGAAYRRDRRAHRIKGHDRPRILQLLATGGNGGAQESYTGLMLRLDRSTYDVRALSLSAGSAVSRLNRLGIPVEVISEADDDVAVRDLTDYLRRQEIDLVHAHMYRAEVVGTRAAVAAGTPVITATVHSSRVRAPEDVAELAALTPFVDRLIVPSESIATKLRREGRGAARFAVIPNGVDLSRFSVAAAPCSLRDDFGIPCDAFLAGVVARLEPEKGHTFLVDAWPLVVDQEPDAWLAIVGAGSLSDELRAQVAGLPLAARSRIVFTGRRDDISAVTADLSVAVLPSLREAQGISILEAMARRRPVVATCVGGIPEVITSGVDGLLVPPADPRALADALLALARSPALRSRLGEAGYQTVASRFSIDAQVLRIEALYAEELVRAGVVSASSASSASSAPLRRSRPSRPRPADRASLELPPI